MLLQRLVELAIFTSIVGSVERAGKCAYLVILKLIRSILIHSSVKLDKTALQNVQRLSPKVVRKKRTSHPYQFSTLPFQKHMQTLNYSLNRQLTALLLSYNTMSADLSGLRFRDFLVQGDDELKQYI